MTDMFRSAHAVMAGILVVPLAFASLLPWAAVCDAATTAAEATAALRAPYPLLSLSKSARIAHISYAASPLALPTVEMLSKRLFDGHLGSDLRLVEGVPGTQTRFSRIGSDGQSVLFVNHAVYDPKATATVQSRNVSGASLTMAATRFVQNTLLKDATFQSLFPLSRKETLKLSGSYSRVATVYGPRQGTSRLLSRSVIFSRYYDGVPFIGPGHKVVVVVTPEQRIVGLQILLPRIAASGATRTVVPQAQFRSSILAAMKPVSADNFFKNEVKKVRCGYYDLRDPMKDTGRPIGPDFMGIEPSCVVDRVAAGPPVLAPVTRFVIPVVQR